MKNLAKICFLGISSFCQTDILYLEISPISDKVMGILKLALPVPKKLLLPLSYIPSQKILQEVIF